MNDDEILYHYTSAAGLLGLLGTSHTPSRMWMTQIQYMNDSAEFYHAYDFAAQHIVEMRQKFPNVRRVISGLWNIPHELDDWKRPPVKGSIMIRYFAFSLTTEPDLLSQWRGYTPRGGYCIGYKVGDLRQMAIANGFDLSQCIYEDADKKVDLYGFLEKTERGILRRNVDPNLGLGSDFSTEQKADATARVAIQHFANARSPYWKHQSFREEREWRLIGHLVVDDNRMRWRAGEGSVIPYLELDIGASGLFHLMPKKIIIGPGADFETSKSAIQFMNYPKHNNIEIAPSTSTYLA